MCACFKAVDKELYSSKIKAPEADFYNFFANLNIPKLDDASRDDINTAVSQADLSDAVRTFPSTKATDPGGFGCEFYKSQGPQGLRLTLQGKYVLASKKGKGKD